MLKVCLEGWRFGPSSFSVVMTNMAAALARRSDVGLTFRDLPFDGPHYRGTEALPSPTDERLVNSIPNALPHEEPDWVYRALIPVEVGPSSMFPKAKVAVQITADSQMVPDNVMQNFRSLKSLADLNRATQFITPSQWSKDGVVNSGVSNSRIHIVPHGVDGSIFCPPTPEERTAARKALDIEEDQFVFLNVSTMSRRKGVDLLVQAFREISLKHPNARLILKGTEELHRCQDRIAQYVRKFQAGDERLEPRPIWKEKMRYIGETLGVWRLAQLYKAADCYVTPYRAEAFNMPALEAAACGLPVIATAGGPTDDFVWSHPIAATLGNDPEIPGGVCLHPDPDDLLKEMLGAMKMPAKSELHGALSDWSWDAATDKLMGVLNAG